MNVHNQADWHDNRIDLEGPGYAVNMLSASRLCELLDYATNYGRLHEELPDGAHPLSGAELRETADPQIRVRILESSVMNVERRTSITVLKQALGILPVDLAGKEPPKTWKIVGVDNFNRDEVADFLVADNVTNETMGTDICKMLNHRSGADAPYFYKLKPASYRLCRGMEDLI